MCALLTARDAASTDTVTAVPGTSGGVAASGTRAKGSSSTKVAGGTTSSAAVAVGFSADKVCADQLPMPHDQQLIAKPLSSKLSTICCLLPVAYCVTLQLSARNPNA